LTRTPTSLSRQISILAFALAGALVALLAGFGWWAASNIDDRSIARETRSVLKGLAEETASISLDQDSAVIWDDAVIYTRADDHAWIADNLAEWMSEYYGFDRVYLLNSDDRPMHVVEDDLRVDNNHFYHDRAAVSDLIAQVRGQLARGEEAGAMDMVVLGQGIPAVASVRPILPSTDAVEVDPDRAFLHIAIKYLDGQIAEEIGTRFEVSGLAFDASAQVDETRVSMPVFSDSGRIIGFFSWLPNEPAYELIHDTAPALGAGLALIAVGMALLLMRLRRTSTALEVSKAHASYLAFHDPLTGIPNRALFEDRLEQALANMRRTGTRIALHYVDLDRFKHVNDTLGHPAGDTLIREAAQRLTALVDEVDTVARLGGDEFAIIQFGASDVPAVIALSQAVVEAIEKPFDLGGSEARVGASVGVVVTEDPKAASEELMRRADIALYQAKDSGRGRYQLFAGDLDEAVRERRLLEIDLRHALADGQGLWLAYQPIYHARSGKIAGAEALVRWDHHRRGNLSPATFVPLAEERGLIDLLGQWVLRTACRHAAASDIPWIAVNVSPLQFRDEHFAERVFAVLDESGLDPRKLEIEITEGLLLQNSPSVQATLMRLRARGVRVALDDFGTGYSSISYLRQHGVDKLKIDQSFTAQLGQDAEIGSIVHSIIELARAMHMIVTAEGVETDEQRSLLEAMGCDQLQGYLLSRPLREADFDALLGRDSVALRETG
jgi:diguanylate cyclase (GGDEF)-like protein